MSIDLEYLRDAYFTFDEPAVYKNANKQEVKIYPVSVKDSAIFLTSTDILNIDKNSFPSVEIIQMSYLEFLWGLAQQKEVNLIKFVNILNLCLKFEKPRMRKNQFDKFELFDEETQTVITAQDFEDIKRIIMYQNVIDFDDEYINPDLKKAMAEVDELKNKNVEVPSLERKIAIITAHCGISKKSQLEMTLRSHSLLFKEVVGEVEFTTVRPVALFAGKDKEIDHWIYKRKKSKFDGYVTNVDDYTRSMGSDHNSIAIADGILGNQYEQLYSNFK